MVLNSASIEIDVKNIEQVNQLLRESVQLAEQLKLQITELNSLTLDPVIDAIANQLATAVAKMAAV